MQATALAKLDKPQQIFEMQTKSVHAHSLWTWNPKTGEPTNTIYFLKQAH